MDRLPTSSEMIAASRVELDQATRDWQAAVAELERIEAQRDAATAPFKQPIANAAVQVAWHKQKVREAIQRLDAVGRR